MTTFSDGVFQFGGVPVITGANIPMFTGNAWFVNSATGSAGNSGKKPSQPFATLLQAVGAAAANNNDVIFLMEGHAENIAASTAVNKAGVQIIGLGNGLRRPAITYITSAAATIAVSADNVSFSNIQFLANFANVTVAFTLTTAKYFRLDSCSVRDLSAILNFVTIVSTNTTNADADGLRIVNNTLALLIATGATKLLAVNGTADRVVVSNNFYRTPTTGTGAPIVLAAGKLLTNSQVSWNRFMLVQTSGTATGVMLTTNGSTNTGMISNNYVKTLAAVATPLLLITASSGFTTFENRVQVSANNSGLLFPAVQT